MKKLTFWTYKVCTFENPFPSYLTVSTCNVKHALKLDKVIPNQYFTYKFTISTEASLTEGEEQRCLNIVTQKLKSAFG